MEHYPVWDFGGNPNIAPWVLEKPLPNKKPTGINRKVYKSYLPRPDRFKHQMSLVFAGTDSQGQIELLKDFADIYGDTELAIFAKQFRKGVETIGGENVEKVNYNIPYYYLSANKLTARLDN